MIGSVPASVASTSISLVISAYLVTLAVLIPASGWVAARFGARPVFLAAIAIFTRWCWRGRPRRS